jgi:hypothetical protein
MGIPGHEPAYRPAGGRKNSVAMNRRFGKLRFWAARLCILLVAAGVFFSCGLESYHVLEPPIRLEYYLGSDEAQFHYFVFRTMESGENDSYIFQGTTVYYKIYTNSATLTSERSSIDNANIQYSANGFNQLTRLGYQELDTAVHDNLLVPQTGVGREVNIRLFDELSWSAEVKIDGSTRGKPLRRSINRGFNFFASAEAEQAQNPIPVAGNPDANFSGTPDGNYYVNAYAVSVGRDDYFTNIYSQLIHLGYITIKNP